MTSFSPAPAGASRWIEAATVLFAVAIFAIDTFTPLDIAVAVLYVVVVLLAANVFDRRGLLLVSAICLTLTVLSFLVSHGFTANAAFLRCLVSLSAIVITTILALANQSTTTMLREQAELLDLTHDTILVRNMKGVVSYWNRAAEQLYGWPREEAVGQTSHGLLRTVFPMPLESIEAELLRTGRWEGDLVHTARDGSHRTVSSRWSLQRDERGHPVAVLESNTDITERSRTQEALLQTRAQLAHMARLTTLGELVASITHEVNQPLGAVVTNGEAALRWLDRPEPDLEEARSALEGVVRAARRASEVIRGLRSLSKKAEAENAPFDIGEAVNEVVLLIQHELVGHRVELHVDLSPSPMTVNGDRIQLQQVILNLVINGMQAMVSVEDRPRELVIRSFRNDDEEIVIGVEDAGVGLPDGDEARLFQPFFSTKSDGMGIGLSISRSIVEAHGGRIWARRNDPHGATFQLALPAHTNASLAAS